MSEANVSSPGGPGGAGPSPSAGGGAASPPPANAPAAGSAASGEPGPASSPSPSGGGEAAGLDGGQRNDVGTLNAGRVEFNHTHQQITQQFTQVYTAQRTVRRFSAADAESVTVEQEQECVRRFRASDGEVEELLVHLSERRVLVLSAAHGARKGSAATSLAWHLRQRGGCTRPTLRVDGLRGHTRIDLLQLARQDPELEGRVTIFRNAFTHGNADLLALFEKTERAGWDHLAGRLRERGAYLVFTTTPAESNGLGELAPVRPLYRELAPHPSAVLGEVLEARLARAERDGVDGTRIQALRASRERILTAFPYAGGLSDFVEFFLEAERPGDVDDALRRFGETGHFLLAELDGDLEAWTFGFTLALTQCARDANGVPWMDFDRLQRQMRQWLRREMELPKGDADEEDAEPSGIRVELSDAALLKRCRAEVVKDPYELADVIRFTGGEAARLWDVMLNRHRRVLSAILPRLRESVERLGDGPGDRSYRALVAQIVGRIGEMDPHRIVTPLATRWWSSANATRQGSVGPLFQGVMGSGSERYRAACLKHLRWMQDESLRTLDATAPLPERAGGDSPGGETAPAAAKPALPPVNERLLTVIGAYTWVGDYDLPLAVRELGVIAREALTPRLKDQQVILRELSRVQVEIEQQKSAGTRLVLRIWRDCLSDVLSGIYAADAPTFFAVQTALVSLCRTTGAIPVFREVRGWITEGGWTMGTLLALMFLYPGGIADALSDERVDVPGSSGRRGGETSALVEALASGEDGVRQTARLLGDLYEAVSTPFEVAGLLKRICAESLMDHLTRWVEDAVQVPEHCAAVQRLFEALARTHEGLFRQALAKLLSSPDFTRGKQEMRDFAASVEQSCLNDRSCSRTAV